MEIHTVTFHPPVDSWLGSARHHDLRVNLALGVADILTATDCAPTMLLPAGFLCSSSDLMRVRLADLMLQGSRQSGATLVFGIDVGSDAGWAPNAPPNRSFLYVCSNGKPLIWNAERITATTPMDSLSIQRNIVLGDLRIGLLIGSEVFNSSVCSQIIAEKPQAILILTHSGPTRRWRKSLSKLNSVVPTILVGQSVGAQVPSVCEPPDGWQRQIVGKTAVLTVHRFGSRSGAGESVYAEVGA